MLSDKPTFFHQKWVSLNQRNTISKHGDMKDVHETKDLEVVISRQNLMAFER